MIIGVPKEIKTGENRVGATPSGVADLTKVGHRVLVEAGAGKGSGFSDLDYERAGAEIVSQSEAWSADLVLKIKEPLKLEYKFFREDLLLFTYLHLANPELELLTKKLRERGVTAIGYESVQLENGELPLLSPMSEVAGKMATQIGARYLKKPEGEKGKLLAEVSGAETPKVTVIGAGNVGTNAVEMAQGMGAEVTVLDIDREKLRELEKIYKGKIATLISNPGNIQRAVKDSDVVIGAVLVPGAEAPKVVTEGMVREMTPGTVIVDVAIDQGGCIETSTPTTHKEPVFKKHQVIHYCVTNMPGAVPRTSTIALTTATLPYVLKIGNLGFKKAVKQIPALAKGVNVYQGFVTLKAVAKAHGLSFKPLNELI